MSATSANGSTFETCRDVRGSVAIGVPAQPVDATQALNLSAGVSSFASRQAAGRCAVGWTFWFNRKRLPGSYFDFSAARRA
jgi:hypothetical protein